MAINYHREMKDKYPDITNTDLWIHLENDKEGMHYAEDISELCFNAIELSESITELLPNFTKHDRVHIKGVCDWMAKLLNNDLSILTKEEVAMLIMVACCHDVGMSLGKENEKLLLEELKTGCLGRSLEEYFSKNSEIESEYKNRDYDANNDALFNRIKRDYIRQRHHLRIEEELNDYYFAGLVGPLRKELIITLCKSHGEDLSDLKEYVDSTGVRIALLAVLLRLADILNFDVSRSPLIKYMHAGLDKPETKEERKSSEEHKKNQICSWTLYDHEVVCTGTCPDNQIMHDITEYIEWVRCEVASSNRLLDQLYRDENPLIVKTVKNQLKGDHFESGDFKISVNAKKIIELLGSENVYGNTNAFLMELVQNSIDAILARSNIDSSFVLDNGMIDIYLWEDDDFVYVRIDDNGTGMDKEIIKKYFLTVGDSYYTSYEFKKTLRESKSTFTPINRFGIGILSCFMSSDTRMEIETKSIKDGNVYRMEITSLDGFYTLYNLEEKKNISELPKPKLVKRFSEGYTRKAGTSICLRRKKMPKSSLVDSYCSYVKKHIRFPLFNINLYVNNETLSFMKKGQFLDEIEIMMGGKKHINILDVLDIYYMDSLQVFAGIGRYKKPDPNVLSGVTTIIAKINMRTAKRIVNPKANNPVSNISGTIPLSSRTTSAIFSFIEKELKYLNSTQKNVICELLADLSKVDRQYPYTCYNGLSFFPDASSYIPSDYTVCSYNFVTGKWIEKINLAKTEFIGKLNEIEYLYNLTNMFSNEDIFWPSYVPYEMIDYYEEELIRICNADVKDGQIRAQYEVVDPRFEYDLKIVSFKRRIHFYYDSNDNLFFYYNLDEQRISEMSHRIYLLLDSPVIFFDQNEDLLKYHRMYNYNNPLVKWLVRNVDNFTQEEKNNISAVLHCFVYDGKPVDYSSALFLLTQMKENHNELFDLEITDYLRKVFGKGGKPPVIYDFDF